jgi:hypothetical protein
MGDEQTEALVIVEGGDFDTVLSDLRALATVTQVLPPRLALVALPPAGRTTIEVPGTAWYEVDVPADVLDRLSDQERLFIDAWRSRRTGKERPGNHLPWDTPGYVPPDWPTDKPSGS